MAPARFLVLLLVAASSAACGQSFTDKAENDEIYHAADEDSDMQNAFRKANQGLDGFLAAWRNPPAGASDFSVKVGVKDGGVTEYFWISPFREESDGFKGNVNNEPRLVGTVAFGDEIAFAKSDIVDWTYSLQGRMIGNHTACAMLQKEPESERRAFEQRFGLRCDP